MNQICYLGYWAIQIQFNIIENVIKVMSMDYNHIDTLISNLHACIGLYKIIYSFIIHA